MKIEYVTGNPGKFKEAQTILSPWQLEQVPLDLVEIQGDPQQILITKAKSALELLNRPLIVEDVSLFCDALHGLPGPYIKDFLRHLGEKGLCDLVHRYPNHRCRVVCTAAYAVPGQEPHVFEGVTLGQIVDPKGTLRHGTYSWNRIFLPDGSPLTFGEMSYETLGNFSARSKALMQLKRYLEQEVMP